MGRQKILPEYQLPGSSAWPFERKCPECGKVFCVELTEIWTFRERDVLLCSWGCVRRREKRREEAAAARARKKQKLTPAQREAMVRRLMFRGMTEDEIGAQLGMTKQNVHYYVRKIEDET